MDNNDFGRLGRGADGEQTLVNEAPAGLHPSSFDALPLIEQIRLVVREEVRTAVADQSRLDQMSEAERFPEIAKF